MSNSVNASTSRSRVVASPDVEPTQPDFRSSYAKYIGRVGALAVALGVGVAVATGSGGGLGAGVAYAQSEGDGADGGGQGAGAGEGTGEGAGVGAGEAPGDLNPAEVPGEEQAGDGDGEPGEGSGNGNGAGVPEMNLNVGGDAQIKGDEEQTQNELGEGQGERQGENEGQDEGEGEGQNEGQGGGLAQSGTGGGVTSYVAPSGNSPVAGAPIVIVPSKPGPSGTTGAGSGQGLIDPSASRLAGGENSMSLFSLNNETQNLQLTTAAAAGTPAPAPLVQQPSNPIEAALGSVVAVANIATTAIATFVSSVLAPGPDTPAPPMMLFVVLGWAQRELQRTFFNQRPTAVVDSTTTSEDLDVDINVLGNDTDPDINTGTDGNPYPGDRLTITDYTQPTNGSVVLNSDGTFTYTPDADFNGTDMFTYTVSDEASPWHLHGLAGFFGGGGHTSTTTVTIGVTPVEDEAVLNPDTGTVTEDGQTNIDVLANDTDADGSIVVSALGPTTNGGSVSINPDGTIQYTPGANAQALDDTESFTDTFTYTTTDALGGTTEGGTVTVTITGLNDAPVAVADTLNATENTPLTLPNSALTGNDTDVDVETLRPAVVLPPANGTLTLHPNGTFTYTPNAGFSGPDSFTYAAYDGTAFSNVVTVSINVNDNPEAVDDAVTVNQDSTGNQIDVLANDTDTDPGQTLTITAVDATSTEGGTVTTDGTTVTYTPANGFSGTDTFTYTISDGAGGTATATVSVTVSDFVTPAFSTYNVGANPLETAIVGDRMFVTRDNGTVAVIDLNTNTEIDTNPNVGGIQAIPVGSQPYSIAARGDYVYVASRGEAVVKVIDANTYEFVDTDPTTDGLQHLPVGIDPYQLLIDGDRLYVASITGESVTVIDTTTNTVIDTDPSTEGTQSISVPTGASAVAVSGDRLYVANIYNGTVVRVFDTDDFSEIDTNDSLDGVQPLSGNGLSQSLGAAVADGKLYVSNNFSGTVSVFDLTTFSAVDTKPSDAGIQPLNLGGRTVDVVAKDNYVYVSDYDNGRVYVIDAETNTLVDTVSVGSGTWRLTVHGDYVYVANHSSGTVRVIDTNQYNIV